MANPFDQFDAQQGNAFDQFDAQQGAPDLSKYSTQERQLISSGQKTPAQIDALHKGYALKAQADKFNPNVDMSYPEQLLATAAQTYYNSGRGIKQVYDRALDFVAPRQQTLSGLVTGQDPSRYAQDVAAQDAAKAQDAPLLNTAGALPGEVLGYGTQALLPGGALKGAGAVADAAGASRIATALGGAGDALLIPKTFKGAAALGGAQGFLQPVGTNDSRLENTGLGATAGLVAQGLPRVAGRLLRPVGDATAGLAQRAQELGIKLTPSQLSNSTFLKTLRSVAGKFPLSGGDAADATQRAQFNQALAGTMGERLDASDPAITTDVMARAKARIGGLFDQAASYGVPVDTQFGKDLLAIKDQAASVLTRDEQAPLNRQISNVLGKVDDNSQISGEAYQALTAHGSPLQRALSSKDSNVRFYAGQLKDALDSAMERNGSPIQRALLGQARPQYRAMKILEPLVAKNPQGNISPAGLAQRVAAKTPNMAYGGGGDLGDLGRIGSTFLKHVIPDSGTAQRSGIQNFMLHAAKPAAIASTGAGALMAGVSGPVTIGSVLGGIGMARVARTILDNPTVAKMMLGKTPEQQQAIVRALLAAQPAERTAQLSYGH